MKRKAAPPDSSPRKVPKIEDYCSTQPKCDENGDPIWPAPEKALEAARQFLQDCAKANQRTLIVPDKDADGLSSGVIIHRTLIKLGLDENLLDVHLVQKGSNIQEEVERKAMLEKRSSFVIVLDQGSRGGAPVIDDSEAKALVIDHHFSDEFPKGATVVSACHYPPVATTALTTYEICKPLHPDLSSSCAYLCAIGTHGDLGNALKWLPPFPDMSETFKKYTKKVLNDCVSYINAPRRTGIYDVITSWTALLNAKDPKEILTNRRLQEARLEINEEVERKTHVAPKFSRDGKIAVLNINSTAQVHPVIATRWASHLKSKALEIVMVANHGYLPGKVNFSCRIAKCARDRDPPVNIIETLKEIARLRSSRGDSVKAGDEDVDEDLVQGGTLVERLGDNFARGHREASGGIVGVKEFEELCSLMGVGEKGDKVEGDGKRKKGVEGQKNTLDGYFKTKSA